MAKFDLSFMKVTVEIPIFLMFFAFGLLETTTFNFIIFRCCYVDFGYNRSECELLGKGNSNSLTEKMEAEIQPYANYILMVVQIVDYVAPSILILFLGPWSDQHGRKPVLIFTIIGFCLGAVIGMVVVLVESMSGWYITGFSIAMTIFGGALPFISTAVCYISDITTDKNRGLRMGIFDAVMLSGNLIGTATSSYILNAGSYAIVYSIVTVCFFLSFFYILFVIVESRHIVKDNRKSKLNVFSLRNFKEIVRTIFKRENYRITTIIILGMIISSLIKMIGNGDSVLYYFLRLKLDWNMEKYTLYKTFRDLLRVIVSLGLISLLHRMLRVKEAPMIIIASVLPFVGMFLQAWATADWHIYLAGVIRSTSGISGAMIRSLLSKLVTKNETGKLFSVTGVLESLVLAGAIPLYTLLYNSSLDVNPGAFNFLTAALFCLLVLFVMISMLVQKFGLKEDTFIAKNSHVNDEKTLKS